MIGKLLGALLFYAATVAITYLLYALFFASPSTEKRYWFWDATVTFVWYDVAESDMDFALGRGRYKVRLPNGRHDAARSFLDESFGLYDCVRVRQQLSGAPPTVPFEIVGPADDCWQPMNRNRSHRPSE